MARILTTGFELNSLTYESSSTGGAASVSTTQKRTGTYSLRLADADSATWTWASKSEVYLGVGFWHQALASDERFLQFQDTLGNTIATIGFNGSGQIVLYRGSTLLATGTTVCAAQAWQYLEVWYKPLNSGGRCTVKLDGVTEIDYTGDTTNSNENCGGMVLNGIVDYSYYDDLVVNDTSGSPNTSWPGIVHLAIITPDGAGDLTQLTPSTGSNYQCVDEIPPSTTDYNSSSTVDQADLYTASNPSLPANAVIKNLVVNMIASLDSGSGSMKPGVKSGSTESFPTSHTLSTASKLYQQAFAVDPADSAAWTSSDINGVQIGAKVA